ncbi:MAG: hypothetical protein WDN00_17165 [Limisphaerales bacterium]
MLACKETAGIHFFALGLAAIIGWRFQAVKKLPPLRIWAVLVHYFFVHDYFAVHVGRTQLVGAG